MGKSASFLVGEVNWRKRRRKRGDSVPLLPPGQFHLKLFWGNYRNVFSCIAFVTLPYNTATNKLKWNSVMRLLQSGGGRAKKKKEEEDAPWAGVFLSSSDSWFCLARGGFVRRDAEFDTNCAVGNLPDPAARQLRRKQSEADCSFLKRTRLIPCCNLPKFH